MSRFRNQQKNEAKASEDAPQCVEKVVHINRCAKVVKGGRRFSFSALVVIGDQKGNIGFGLGKAKEVPEAIRKGSEAAKHNMFAVQTLDKTIPHDALGLADGGKVLLRPACPGTGVKAGGGVRAVLECAGIENILTKSLGSNNPQALVNATVHALKQMRSPDQIRNIRKTKVAVEA